MDDAARRVTELERLAEESAQSGRAQQAVAAWAELLRLRPGHVGALLGLGQLALTNGDLQAARNAFERCVRAAPDDGRGWLQLALCAERQDDDVTVEQAVHKVLSMAPYDLLALLLRGRLHERRGQPAAAARAYGAAATVAPPMERLREDLRPWLQHAMAYRDGHQQRLGQFLDGALETVRRHVGPRDCARFDLSVDILLGRRKRFDSQPMRLYMPGLLPVEFFDRRLFPWLEEVEARTAEVRDEFLQLLAADAGFEPYIQYRDDEPVAQWAELNHNPDWSAFHLVKDGAPVAEHAARCPRTMAMWERVPSPVQHGRTPVALFSLLKPHTHIPPHVGSSNVRLLTHLPLIVPPGCRFRVGNSVREWVEGRAWVFDDTIEHEAHNDSDRLRTIMIFDVWHPDLHEGERHLLTALAAAMDEFSSGGDEPYGA